MKRLIAAAILLAAVIGICIAGNRAVTSVQREATRLLEGCEEAIRAEDFDSARAEIDGLTDYWRSKRTLLAAFVNHKRYEEAEAAMLRIGEQLENESRDDALPECAEVRMMLEEIAAEQKLRFSNIL